MRRSLAVIPFVALALSSWARIDTPSASKLMADAQAQAKLEKKNVFVVFQASW